MHVLCDPCRESNTSLLACRRDWPLTQARTGFLVVHPALVILMSRCMHCGWNTSTELCQKAYTRVYHILQNQARICSPTLYLTKLYRRSSRLCNSVHHWEHVSEIHSTRKSCKTGSFTTPECIFNLVVIGLLYMAYPDGCRNKLHSCQG